MNKNVVVSMLLTQRTHGL